MRSLSNLIKSERVEVGVPVQVGLSSYRKSGVGKVIHAQQPKEEEKIQAEVTTLSDEILVQLEKQKEDLLQQYKKEAEQKAQAFYQSEMEKARQEGLKAAEIEAEQVLDTAKQKYDEILEEAVQIKEAAATDYKETIKSAEKEIVELSVYIAEKIINTEVNKSDDYIINIIKDAMERVVSKDDVILRLSPEDYITVTSNKKYWVTKIKGLGEIKIEEDTAMEPGGCIIDTPYGMMDAGMSVRMDKIQKAILELIEKEA